MEIPQPRGSKRDSNCAGYSDGRERIGGRLYPYRSSFGGQKSVECVVLGIGNVYERIHVSSASYKLCGGVIGPDNRQRRQSACTGGASRQAIAATIGGEDHGITARRKYPGRRFVLGC